MLQYNIYANSRHNFYNNSLSICCFLSFLNSTLLSISFPEKPEFYQIFSLDNKSQFYTNRGTVEVGNFINNLKPKRLLWHV